MFSLSNKQSSCRLCILHDADMTPLYCCHLEKYIWLNKAVHYNTVELSPLHKRSFRSHLQQKRWSMLQEYIRNNSIIITNDNALQTIAGVLDSGTPPLHQIMAWCVRQRANITSNADSRNCKDKIVESDFQLILNRWIKLIRWFLCKRRDPTIITLAHGYIHAIYTPGPIWRWIICRNKMGPLGIPLYPNFSAPDYWNLSAWYASDPVPVFITRGEMINFGWILATRVNVIHMSSAAIRLCLSGNRTWDWLWILL